MVNEESEVIFRIEVGISSSAALPAGLRHNIFLTHFLLHRLLPLVEPCQWLLSVAFPTASVAPKNSLAEEIEI